MKTKCTFIQSLPPMPSARPLIRSLVAQLAREDNSGFRKRLHAVLLGKHAFHIRRLVAECLAEHPPHEEDGPFLQSLRREQRPVFELVYAQASHVAWHFFWLGHLVPMLEETKDTHGLLGHAEHMARWVNEDPQGVLGFWLALVRMEGLDKALIAHRMALSLGKVSDEHIHLFAPLLVELLGFPLEAHSPLGRALARCLVRGGVDDAVLWRYIGFDEAPHAHKKLRCGPHAFDESNEKFLSQRMQQSADLLTLAVSSLEQWSQAQHPHPGGGFASRFLEKTSYLRVRSHADFSLDNERILLDAIEEGIVHHAQTHSPWWTTHRERLCFNAEGALRYCALVACTKAPTENLELIARMLCEKPLLESEFRFELGELMEAAFVLLPKKAQKAIEETLLGLFQEEVAGDNVPAWVLTERVRKQAQLLVCIPRPLRSKKSLAVVNEYENSIPHYRRQPRMVAEREGCVGAPFSFKVFLDAKSTKVFRLLMQYAGKPGENFLAGEEKAVGEQLREATSRHPNRFVTLLSAHWAEFNSCFRDSMIEGIAEYLAYRHGQAQPDRNWWPIENIDATVLAQKVLDTLEMHPKHWRHNRSAAKALHSCAHVVRSKNDAERVVLLALGFATSGDRARSGMDARFVEAQKDATEALMAIAARFFEAGVEWPAVLIPALQQLASDKCTAIRAVLLRRLPHVQQLWPELGWELFRLAFQEEGTGLWEEAEACLHKAPYETAAPWLARLAREGKGKALQTWGRLSALAALQQHMDSAALLKELQSLNDKEAWEGAASVWTHPEHWPCNSKLCVAGLKAALSAKNQHALTVAHQLCKRFEEESFSLLIPLELLRRCFTLLKRDETLSRHSFLGLEAWLGRVSCQAPSFALDVAEAFVQTLGAQLDMYSPHLPPVFSHLWAYAEAQEVLDGGATLQRVAALQEALRA